VIVRDEVVFTMTKEVGAGAAARTGARAKLLVGGE